MRSFLPSEISKIVRRIAIKKRNGFGWTMNIERACMDDLVGASASFLGPKRIKFDSAAMAFYASRDCTESVAFADAWIKRHETGHQLDVPANAPGFRQWKRVVPETQSSFDSHRGDYSFLPA